MKGPRRPFISRDALIRKIELIGVDGRKDPGCGVCGKPNVYTIYKRADWEWTLLCSACHQYKVGPGWVFVENYKPGTTRVKAVPDVVPPKIGWEKYKPRRKEPEAGWSVKRSNPFGNELMQPDTSEEGILGTDGEFDTDGE